MLTPERLYLFKTPQGLASMSRCVALMNPGNICKNLQAGRRIRPAVRVYRTTTKTLSY